MDVSCTILVTTEEKNGMGWVDHMGIMPQYNDSSDDSCLIVLHCQIFLNFKNINVPTSALTALRKSLT